MSRHQIRTLHEALAETLRDECWSSSLDGFSILATQLKEILGLHRLNGTRLLWLEQDVKHIFPVLRVARSRHGTIDAVILCRTELNAATTKIGKFVGSFLDKP